MRWRFTQKTQTSSRWAHWDDFGGPTQNAALFKTTDGGKTWKKVLFVDDKTGVIDVQVNPKNPDDIAGCDLRTKARRIRRQRSGQRFGDGLRNLQIPTDGGESFQRITEGLPTCKMGRIGLDYFEADPNFVVAIIESEKIAKEPENYAVCGNSRGEDADVGAQD